MIFFLKRLNLPKIKIIFTDQFLHIIISEGYTYSAVIGINEFASFVDNFGTEAKIFISRENLKVRVWQM